MLGDHASRNDRIVSEIILVVAILLYGSSAYADNKVLARIIFEEAKASYDAGSYDAALSQLSDAEAQLGSINAPISALRLKVRYAILSSSAQLDKVEAETLRKDAHSFLETYGDDERLEGEAKEIYRIYDALGRPLQPETASKAILEGSDVSSGHRVDCETLEITTPQSSEYGEHWGNLIANKHSEAKSGFLEFIKKNPCSRYTALAHSNVASIYEYIEKNRGKAIEHYAIIIDEYPYAIQIPPILLRLGILEIEGGRRESGVARLNRIIREFPDSDEATEAEKKIIGME